MNIETNKKDILTQLVMTMEILGWQPCYRYIWQDENCSAILSRIRENIRKRLFTLVRMMWKYGKQGKIKHAFVLRAEIKISLKKFKELIKDYETPQYSDTFAPILNEIRGYNNE